MTPEFRRLEGGCHCGSLAYQLDWPAASTIPARRCTCGYCTRFNGTWTSHPEARLEIIHADQANHYRFGTGTADFLACRHCGIVVAAVCDAGDGPRGIVNVNTLAESATLSFEHSDSDFDGESVEDRLARRLDRWIGNVIMTNHE